MQARGRHNQRDGVLIALVASGLVTVSITGGWLLGQHQALHAGAPRGAGAAGRLLQARSGTIGEAADQQRLVDLLINRAIRGGQPVLEPLVIVVQNRQLRLLLAELRRNNNDRPGAERELRQPGTQTDQRGPAIADPAATRAGARARRKPSSRPC